MKIALDSAVSGYLVKTCTPGRVVLHRRRDTEAPAPDAVRPELVLTASAVVSPWAEPVVWTPPPIAELHLAALEVALEAGLEVLLLGTGARLRWPARSLVREVNARGVGFEVMDTPTACRTYNVLALERRRVAAALVIG